jgi:hypothetical protein
VLEHGAPSLLPLNYSAAFVPLLDLSMEILAVYLLLFTPSQMSIYTFRLARGILLSNYGVFSKFTWNLQLIWPHYLVLQMRKLNRNTLKKTVFVA